MTPPARRRSTGQRRRRTSTGVALSEQVYVEAATNLLERRGAGVLSVRTLGAAVGADPTALYRYFAGVDDVVRAVADRMIGLALQDWSPGSDWLESLADLAHRLYDVYVRRYPRVGNVVAARTTGLPNELRAVQAVLSLLHSAGFDERTAVSRFQSIADCLLAHAALDSAFAALPSETQRADLATWAGHRPTERSLSASLPHLVDQMSQSSFESSLRLMLLGLDASPRSDSTEAACRAISGAEADPPVGR